MVGIDIGNTHTEIGIITEDQIVDSFRVSTILHRTEDEFWYFVDHFLSRNSLSPLNIDYIFISSVVPGLNFIFQKLIQKYFHREPFFIRSEMDLGIQINYDNPNQVGADRICNAVAAFHKFKDNCIILDFGTATTFDIVYKEGSYEGGIISAGLETTNWGLHAKADLLPKVKLEYPNAIVGKNTEIAIQIGLIKGTVHLINGLIDEIISTTQRKYRIIATGGLANIIVPNLKYETIYEPKLVLEGIRIIAKRILDID